MHELYIDGYLIDVDDNVDITLLYQSMLFTDLDSIVSNRSYSIDLPITANNMRIFGYANITDILDYGAFSKFHDVRYYRNGVTICENGQCQLLNISKRISIAFSFGNIDTFKMLTDKNLNELPDTVSLPWNDNPTSLGRGTYKDALFVYADFGQGVNCQQYNHPMVSARWILSQITQYTGIVFDSMISEEGRPCDRFERFYIPLLDRQAGVTQWESDHIYGEMKVLFRTEFTGNRCNMFGFNIGYEAISTDRLSFYGEVDNKASFSMRGGKSFNMKFERFEVTVLSVVLAGKLPPEDLTVNVVDNNNVIINKIVLPLNWVDKGSIYYSAKYSIEKYELNEIIDADSVSLTMDNVAYYYTPMFETNRIYYGNRVTKVTGSLSFTPKYKELVYPTTFPLSPNLPNMSISDFVKGLMQLTGVFAYLKGDNVIGFVPIDDICSKIYSKEKAYYWTNKLIDSTPDNITSKLDGFAQQNICTFSDPDDDDLNLKLFQDAIIVNNATIEKEKDCVTLPFAPTKLVVYNDQYFPSIQLYTSGSDGNIEFNDDLTPRILLAYPDRVFDRLYITQKGLEFKTILATNYSKYQEIVIQPRVLKVKCLLNNIDIAQLDLTNPVYFEQLGHAYALLKVQVPENNVCECELLEI